MKRCPSCGEIKSFEDFVKSKSRRNGIGSYCKPCKRLQAAEDSKNNADKVASRRRKWAEKNADKISLERKIKREDPLCRKLDNERRALHKRLHPEIANAAKAKRKASKLQATPKWADNNKVKELYKLSVELTKSTGIQHHVDHIVPLMSRIVSGLHWEGNLRVIPAIDNIRKSNITWPDMPL